MPDSTRPRSTRATIRRRIIPVACLAIGFALLTGCFTIPATQQFQANGKLRPETLVGQSKNSKIALGSTPVEDALAALREKTGGAYYVSNEFGPNSSYDKQDFDWAFSDDGRKVGVTYQVRAGTEVWPLCFAAGPTINHRQLVLDVNDQGIVTGSRVANADEGDPAMLTQFISNEPHRVLDVFSPEQRRRLHAAGVLPGDDELRQRYEALRRGRRWSGFGEMPTSTPVHGAPQ